MMRVQLRAVLVVGYLSALPLFGIAQGFGDSPSDIGFDEPAPLMENYRVVKTNALGSASGHYNLAFEYGVKENRSIQLLAGRHSVDNNYFVVTEFRWYPKSSVCEGLYLAPLAEFTLGEPYFFVDSGLMLGYQFFLGGFVADVFIRRLVLQYPNPFSYIDYWGRNRDNYLTGGPGPERLGVGVNLGFGW